jgi:parallel beta-helix repeat protein
MLTLLSGMPLWRGASRLLPLTFVVVACSERPEATAPSRPLAQVAPAAAQESPAIIVDRDEVECPDADFNSIQEAVAAAPPGATIRVCPDVYNEEVTVDKPLTLKGTGHGGNANGLCFTPSTPDPRHDSILDGQNVLQSGFIVESDGVIIDGFVIQNYEIGITTMPPDPNVSSELRSALAAGGYTGFSRLNPVALSVTAAKAGRGPKFSRLRISDNMVQDNLFIGLFLQNVSENLEDVSVVTHNCFRTNLDVPPELLEKQFAGVLSLGNLENASIDNNGFLRHSIVGAGLLDLVAEPGSAPASVTIAHNQSREDFVSYGFQGSTGVTMTYNQSFGNTFCAIFIANGNTHSRIDHNLLLDGARGLYFDSFFPFTGPPSTEMDVHDNKIRHMVGSLGFPGSGISIEVSEFGSLQNSRLTNNVASDNTQDGIRIESCSFQDTTCPGFNKDNVIANNQLRGNAQHDCHDDSEGTGTAGTQNSWIRNHGETENREGLCPRAMFVGPFPQEPPL